MLPRQDMITVTTYEHLKCAACLCYLVGKTSKHKFKIQP